MRSNFNQAFEKALNRPENSKIKRRLNSFQFTISQDILGERISLGLSPQKAASLVGLSEEEYRKYENGINMVATKEDYNSILDRLMTLSNQAKPRFVGSGKNIFTFNDGRVAFVSDAEMINIINSKENKDQLLNFIVSTTTNEKCKNYTYDGVRTDSKEKSENKHETKLSGLFINKSSIQTEEYRVAYF